MFLVELMSELQVIYEAGFPDKEFRASWNTAPVDLAVALTCSQQGLPRKQDHPQLKTQAHQRFKHEGVVSIVSQPESAHACDRSSKRTS